VTSRARGRAAVLWAVLAGGQVVLAAAVFLLAGCLPIDPAPAPVAALLAVLGLAATALSFAIPARIRAEAPPEAVALARVVVAAALAGSGTTIALLGWLAARAPWLLGAAALSFAALFLHYPSGPRFARMVR
jgi:hypothetical protein